MIKKTLAALAAGVLTLNATAGIITGDTADALVRDTDYNGTGDEIADAGKDFFAIGNFSTEGMNTAIWVFSLPSIVPGEELDTAAFSTQFWNKKNSPDFNVDLYALRVSASSEVLTSDFDMSGATLLQSDWITPTTSTGRLGTDNASSTALTSYLKDNYSAGSYLFIGAAGDVLQPGAGMRYNLSSANRSADLPELSITTSTAVPEPASMLMLLLTGSALLIRRR